MLNTTNLLRPVLKDSRKRLHCLRVYHLTLHMPPSHLVFLLTAIHFHCIFYCFKSLSVCYRVNVFLKFLSTAIVFCNFILILL